MFFAIAFANFIACVFSFVMREYSLGFSFVLGIIYSIKIAFTNSHIKELHRDLDKLKEQVNDKKEEKPTTTDETPAD